VEIKNGFVKSISVEVRLTRPVFRETRSLMSDVEKELQHRVDTFVHELSALIRRQALAAVEELLQKGEHAGAHAGHAVARKPGRPAKAAEPKPVGRPAKPTAAAKRKPGEKRTPQELAQLTEQLYHYIKSNPGQGVEQIAKGIGHPTKELTLPIRKLIGDKKISSKGQKRATRYSPR
jgi:hypothetical protein